MRNGLWASCSASDPAPVQGLARTAQDAPSAGDPNTHMGLLEETPCSSLWPETA